MKSGAAKPRAMMITLLLALFVLGMAVFSHGAHAQEAAPSGDRLELVIEVLKDETARDALIAELEGFVAEPAPDAAAEEAAPEVSIGRKLALLTQEFAQFTAEQIGRSVSGLSGAGQVFSNVGTEEISVLGDALLDLFLVIALTVVIFTVLRRLVLPFFRRMGRKAEQTGIVQTSLFFLASVVADVLVVVIAWAAGYIVTVTFLGEFGQIGIRQTLYLNAFFIVELGKVAMRSVISPTAGGLRLLPIEDVGARRLNKYLTWVVSMLGYGQLLVVPIVNQSASFAAGRSVSAALSVFVLLLLAFGVLRHRHAVADWMIGAFRSPVDAVSSIDATSEVGAPSTHEPRGAAILRHWHWFALLYLLFIFSTVMAGSTDALVDAVTASGKIALAVILASLLSRQLAASMAAGVTLPGEISSKLPLLERRLNAIVPKALFVLRYFILAIVVLFALDVVGALSLSSWLEGQFGRQVTSALLAVATIILVITLLWLAVTSWVDYRLNPDYGSAPTARETTLLTLLRNAVTIVLIAFAVMFCLSEIGLDIGPLLASAGVLGLAIGFGAQKMVQDIITGVFMQFENAINVGDVITVGGVTGGVEKLSVRSVSLRDVHGVFHIIPFSSVDMVSNFTRDFSYFVCDMGIAYREDIEEAKKAMFDGFERLRLDEQQAQFIVGDLEWFGLNTFGDSAVVLRARIKTVPGKQWGIGRAYNAILKEIFDDRGIEIPFPHQTIYFGESKQGSTQTLKISSEPEAGTAS